MRYVRVLRPTHETLMTYLAEIPRITLDRYILGIILTVDCEHLHVLVRLIPWYERDEQEAEGDL